MIKRYHPPVPPAARVLAHPGVAEADKQRLQAMMETANPVHCSLVSSPRRRSLAGGSIVVAYAKIEEPAVIDLQRFAANLKTAWKRASAAVWADQTLSEETSMYEPFEAQIKGWLEEEPALSAASVLQRLIKIAPSRFKERT
ncbi:hypothetical protein [Mesorhizobium sp. M6A.T.Ce.TU.002.03.1.1]|uniref:hypothetical protein n=1 Tax=Mesorhizobium sp. M6A.T.Ce.TU.002.03.1.1 TaxID=2496782 RepID=UPI001FE096B5|nr:hypothetical protein [Mesorhizobium sp. M6A.T.Ce.TU.002.03.1.1]